ncbi:MAG TPA: hypothetical protein VIW78_00880 [Burkholderiales bacterium]
MTPISSLFEDEWARFNKGLAQLNPLDALAYKEAYYRAKRNPDGYTTINLPGWSDTFHLEGPGPWTREGALEYYAAKSEKRAPNLSAPEVTELRRREVQKDRMAQSAQPGYSQGFGTVLTAIDNIQDFVSTVATFARLALWGLPKVTQWMSPAASEGTARALAEVAGRRAEAAAAAAFGQQLAGRAAAGELAARLALADSTVAAGLARVEIKAAGELAAKLAFERAALGLGGRLVGRFLPIVGEILLVSDLLNMLSLIGMMATPAYALACQGPAEAVASGLPSALMKGALKREFWTMARHNPFGMEARASRKLRSLGRLPSVGNLLEVAQTTDQLFGVGISLGAWVGVATEISMAPLILARGGSVGINAPEEAQTVSAAARRKFGGMPPYKQALVLQAGQVSTGAGMVWRVQDVFTEEEHLWTAVVSLEATAVLYDFWHDLDLPAVMETLTDVPMRAPLTIAPDTALWAESRGLDVAGHRGWWLPGAPEWATPADLMADSIREVPGAVARLIRPRRMAPTGAFFGAAVTQLTDWTFMLAEGDPDLFKWSLTTDSRLLSSFTEAGFLMPQTADPAAYWRLWTAARARLDAKGWTSLPATEWVKLAAEAGAVLMPALAPEAAVPAAYLAEADTSLL